jgi:hypothetical protein
MSKPIIHFSKKVGKSRAAMIAFLREHFRYDTMNSWNASTSYANRIKIRFVPIPIGLRDAAYDMLEADKWHGRMNAFLYEFGEEHGREWLLCVNGRSGGYVVLYVGDGKGGVFAGRSVDQGETFEDWDTDSIRERVKLVRDFDLTCDLILNEFVAYCERFEVKDETVLVPKTVKVLVEK